MTLHPDPEYRPIPVKAVIPRSRGARSQRINPRIPADQPAAIIADDTRRHRLHDRGTGSPIRATETDYRRNQNPCIVSRGIPARGELSRQAGPDREQRPSALDENYCRSHPPPLLHKQVSRVIIRHTRSRAARICQLLRSRPGDNCGIQTPQKVLVQVHILFGNKNGFK